MNYHYAGDMHRDLPMLSYETSPLCQPAIVCIPSVPTAESHGSLGPATSKPIVKSQHHVGPTGKTQRVSCFNSIMLVILSLSGYAQIPLTCDVVSTMLLLDD